MNLSTTHNDSLLDSWTEFKPQMSNVVKNILEMTNVVK